MSGMAIQGQSDAVRIRRVGAVAVVEIDFPPVNALSRAVRQGLLDAMRALAPDNSVAAVVLTGTGRRFIAGADLKEMDLPPDDPILPVVVAAIAALPLPVVAALGGPALGGGLELALAADYRLAAPGISLGFPETRLGLVPGAGGTQRLARLVGVARAIPLIAEAKIVIAVQALAAGLVDAIAGDDLLAEAIALAPNIAKRPLHLAPVPQDAESDIAAAADAALRRARGVPAIAEAIAILRAVPGQDFAAGAAQERAAFLRLRESQEARALRHLFLAEREAARVPGLADVKPRPLDRAAVIGAGTMGAGIAVCLADAGIPVALIERDAAAAEQGAARVRAIYAKQVAAGRISADTAAARGALVQPGDDWSVLDSVDLVIEAAFEDMAVKADIFRRIDRLARPGTMLATNTSYLDVDAIAGLTARPGDVLGLHFFSPAQMMRLLEVVRGAATLPDVLASGLALARRIGKLPVVAGVCDGFIGNRIFAAFRRHAEYLLEDGAAPEAIDAALVGFGFAMGPFAVSDLAGLDISWAMRKRRAATRPAGERYVSIADRICEAGRFGRKTGSGWYRYDQGKPVPDPDTAAIIAAVRAERGIAPRAFTAQEICRRLLAVMANEAANILAEGIAQRPSDIDLVFVNGYGFPRLAGGPVYLADQTGLAAVLAEMRAAHQAGGLGSEPAPLLEALVASASSFAAWQRGRMSDTR